MGNSVIYRPAYDAEVEYLESDGNSYIDTGLKVSSELGILAHIQNSQDEDGWAFGGNDSVGNKELSFAPKNELNQSLWRFDSYITRLNALNSALIYELSNIQNHNVLKIGESTYTATSSTFESQNNLSLFARGSDPLRGVRIYDFKIYQNSTLVRDFIPVRIGQVGYLYDKVTKQLFGNKGTGQFILGNDVSNAVIPQQRCVLYFGSQRCVGYERVYEEYEWLKGDGSAYIDSNIIVNVPTLYISTSFTKSNSQTHEPLFGSRNTISASGSQIFYLTSEKLRFDVITHDNTAWVYVSPIGNINTLVLDAINIQAIFNGTLINGTATSSDMTDKNSVNTFKIFSLYRLNTTGSNNNRPFSGAFGNFVLNDGTHSLNLIPCKLLQSIPAILDGNGIARQSGECGMWDKVSGRFYGNVANSGTFTVKGAKCYEEYEWLITENSGGASMMSLPLNTNDFSFKRRILELNGNSYYFLEGKNSALQYFTLGTNILKVHEDGVTTFASIAQVSVGDDIEIKSTSNSLTFNGEVVPIPSSYFTYLRFKKSIGGTIMKISTSSITIDGSVRYIPCKLTHYIPASMDANGIPRPSGTCGMWDKVNDKFYGNVANSGSFSVSN